MTKRYQLILVMHPDFSHDNEKKREEAVRAIMGEDVTIKEIAVLGKKSLAYPIKKQIDGVYLQATLESSPLQVGDVQKRARVRDDVLRYLLTAK